MRTLILAIFQLVFVTGWAQPVLVPFKTKAGKWQLVEKYTTTKVLGDYDRIDYVKDRIYQVWINHKAGLVDVSGKQLLPIEYRPVSGIDRFSEGMYPLEKNGKVTWFTNKGEAAYDWSFIVAPSHAGYYTKGLHKTLCGGGYLDKKGKLVIPAAGDWYDYDQFSEKGLAIVTIRKSKPVDSVRLDYGVIDTTGKLIIPIKYDLLSVKDDYVEAYDMVSYETGECDYDCYALNGIKFLSGRYVFLKVYYKAGLFSYSNEQENKYSLRMLGDHREISDEFDEMYNFPGSRVLAYGKNGTFLVNRQGEITKLFDKQVRITSDRFGRYVMENDNRTCVYDSSGHELFCFNGDSTLLYSYPEDTKEGFAIVDNKSKKWGYINTEGKMLVPCLFDGVWYIPEMNIWMVKEDPHYIFYFIDEKGNRYIEQ